MAVVAAASNIPLTFQDKLSPTIRNILPDSKLASKYHSASTKATCMLNGAVAPTMKGELLDKMVNKMSEMSKMHKETIINYIAS